MKLISTIDIMAGNRYVDLRSSFRGRDDWCLSDRRDCLRWISGKELTFSFGVDSVEKGTAEIVFTGCLDIHDSGAYVGTHLNSVLEILVNDTVVFDGILHWRSHEETVAFWNPFDFPFDSSLLREGENTIVLRNKGTRETLGEYFDEQLLEVLDEDEALAKLTTIHLSTLEVNFVRPPEETPRLTGVPRTAVVGVPFIVEINSGDEELAVTVSRQSNVKVEEIGAAHEFGAWRSLFRVTAAEPGTPCELVFSVGSVELPLAVYRVYANAGIDELIIGPGAETTYWHMLKVAARDFFELESGNCFRMSIDGYLANLHFVPKEKWKPLIEYLVRRRRFYTLQRIRIPEYSKMEHSELLELADIGGSELFAGISVVEPVLFLHRGDHCPDLKERLDAYLSYFKGRMDEVRLPGHRLVTFDSAAGLCGHYYRAGLDCYIAEVGPACNCVEEACGRGAATAFGAPWGTATAMHWYCGQGAQYAYDDARVRFAFLNMLSSYLAGARQILWEGGVFDNLPVYNYILSEESWRDYGRRYYDVELVNMRASFGKTLDFHRAHQLSSPKVRFAMLRGTNDVFDGTFGDNVSAHGDMSMARSWSLLKVFLPHVNWGRRGTDHGRKHRRWYSGTPYGQVDVLPAEADQEHYDKYQFIALASWNTMTDEMYRKLVEYVRSGGTLFMSLPQLATDTVQSLEWTFYNDGDVSELCGIKVHDIGGRIEKVSFNTRAFRDHLPEEMVLSERNNLFTSDFDETYAVFSQDVTYFAGKIDVSSAEVLAESQRGEPVLLRNDVGEGEVYLLNSYHYQGRGRMLDLAEGIMKTLVEKQDRSILVEDPHNLISWFEYPSEDFTRYFFLNTEWTVESGIVSVTVTIDRDEFDIHVPEGRPVQLVSDGIRHVRITDPAVQVISWEADRDNVKVVIAGGSSSEVIGVGQTRAEVVSLPVG